VIKELKKAIKEIFYTVKGGNIQEIKQLIDKYEKYFSPLALFFGFIVDSLTLTRVDLWLDNIILLSYMILIGGSILMLNASESGHFKNRTVRKGVLWLPFLMQFAFGGLFSGFVVLYSRSSSIMASWPFLSVLFLLLIGNEFFKDKYKRLFFQLNIFYIAIFSYLIFAVPVVLNRMGPFVFVLSGLVSLLLIAGLVKLIARITPWKVYFNQRTITYMIGAIFAGFNFLYFLNIIPPIPLALKDIVIAHSVELQRGAPVRVTFEDPPWYKFYREYDNIYHRVGNEPVFVYSAVFAPTDLTATIVHEWAFWDEANGKWRTTDQITYPIYGGRNEGYRGFSTKSHVTPGKWRVSVKTKNGQLLGRTKFTIEEADSLPELKAEIR
jgi:hypothetical protein